MVKEKGTALAEAPELGTVDNPGEVAGLIALAINKGVPVEVLERLFELKKRVEENDARGAFFRAFASLQSEMGAVPKTSAIEVTRGGVQEVRSRYAGLDDIVQHVRPLLQKHGFIVQWNSVVRDNGNVCITCFLRHVDGHTESADFEFAQKDAGAPGMNGVQIAGSARTYGERYSLIQVLGLTTTDPDDDGGAGENLEPISEAQFNELTTIAGEVRADIKRFVEFLGVDSMRDIPASRFQEAKNALEQKRLRK